MNCATKNIIYTLICTGCDEFYIGETGNTLRTRTRVHKQQITDNNYRSLPVSQHIHNCNNNDFRIMPIFKINKPDTRPRKEKEKHFLRLLSPQLNSLNT